MKKLISVLLILTLLLPCAFAGADFAADGMAGVLDKLDKNSYRTAYESLLEGEILEKGAENNTAKALQRVLKAFGQDVSTDGKAGSGTFKELNKVQNRYGMEPTDYVDAEVFAELLCALLVYQEGEDAEEAVLEAGLPEGEYYYCLARKQASDGRYYRAKCSYEASGWADWADRADSCAQKWPSDGRIWKKSSLIGSGVTFKIKVRNTDSDTANVFKLYNSDDKLVAVLFIGGNGSASTTLKAGRYTIKQGTGTEWYGRKDAFGEDGWYSTLDVNGETSFKLKNGYIYTLTINTDDIDPNSDSVGSSYENWGDF